METSQGAKVELSKDFPVSKDRLYKAWTSEEDLKNWWKPLRGKLSKVENDIREGGTVKYSFTEDDQKEFLIISGEYEEAKPAEKLVYTWNWQGPDELLSNGKYKLTIAFTESGQQSTLSVIQEDQSEQENVYPHQQGWEKSLNDLYTYLSSQGSDKKSLSAEPTATDSTEGANGAEVPGYNEAPDQQKVGGA